MTVKPFAIKMAAVVVVVAVVAAVDIVLANMERTETAQDARQFYDEGQRALQQGRVAEAIDSLQRAHALDRRNRTYELGWIAALLAGHRTDEAKTELDSVLQEDPDNGQANLLMARLLTSTGNADQAEAYYHRAIYGEWPDKAAQHRIEVRMELIKLLASRGKQSELLSELLPLESETQDNPAIQKQIAHWFVVSGSPARAADLYRALIRENRRDGDLYTGLGQAELELGDYQAALPAFINAYRRKPDDPTARQNMEIAHDATTLDPTPRWLRSNEKYERSVHILQLAREAAQACGASQDLLSQADKVLGDKPPKRPTNEDAEARLSLAEQLWSARRKDCPMPENLQPLRLVMEKLSQQK